MGIGEAMCRRFAKEAPTVIVVVDIDKDRAEFVARQVSGIAMQGDVTVETDIINIVKQTEQTYGRVDLFCSNAGIISNDEPEGTVASCSNEIWQKSWEIHVMAHIYAARAALPGMLKRKKGYFLNTASAAGLLNLIGGAPYAVSKHAAVGFAESLAITHGDDGIQVSLLCPQAVQTRMIKGNERQLSIEDGIINPTDLAEIVVQGLNKELFLILPHAQVEKYFKNKAGDYDRWIVNMRNYKNRQV